MKRQYSLGLALGFSCSAYVEGEEGLFSEKGLKPSVRYHSGRARILRLCQELTLTNLIGQLLKPLGFLQAFLTIVNNY
ncbi:hypothetical protein DITRI_Ditri18aG0033000 [Diplodiscus trichospermus]